MDRLLLVAAFAQIGFSAGLRPYKCLNPVMGETFEVRPFPCKCQGNTFSAFLSCCCCYIYYLLMRAASFRSAVVLYIALPHHEARSQVSHLYSQPPAVSSTQQHRVLVPNSSSGC